MSVFSQTIRMKAAHCAARNIRRSIKEKTERRVTYQVPCACAGVMAVNHRGDSLKVVPINISSGNERAVNVDWSIQLCSTLTQIARR